MTHTGLRSIAFDTARGEVAAGPIDTNFGNILAVAAYSGKPAMRRALIN